MDSPTIIPPTPTAPLLDAMSTAATYTPDIGPPPAKRFKPNELPLISQQRSTIDTLLHTFKKQGAFDVVRKSAYSAFDTSAAKSTLISSLTSLADAELERNPSLLAKDRRQAAPLIEGAVERSEIYRIAELDVEKIVEQCARDAESRFRDIRVKEVGAEKAAQEQLHGAKSDEAYAEEARLRLEKRRKIQDEELARKREREAEEKRKADEAARVQREEAEKERQRRREWEQEMLERAERKKRQDAEWERERLEKETRKRDRLEKEDRERRSLEEKEYRVRRERSEKEDHEKRKWREDREKEIENAALEELLKEGHDLAKAKERNDALTKGSTPRTREKLEKERKESAVDAIMRREKLEKEQASVKRPDEESLDRDPAVKAAQDDGHRSRTDSRHRYNGSRSPSRRERSSRHHEYHDRDRHAEHREPRPHYYQDDHNSQSRSRHERDDRPRRHYDTIDDAKSSHRYHHDHERDRHDRHHKYDDHSRDYRSDDHYKRRDREDHHRHRDSDEYPRHHHHDSPDRHRHPDADDYPRHRPKDLSDHRRQQDSDHHQAHRSHKSRSRSPTRHKPSHHRREREREVDDKEGPVEIDRYVPSGSSRSMTEGGRRKIINRAEEEEERRRRGEREGRSGSGRERERDRVKDKDRERAKEGDAKEEGEVESGQRRRDD